MLSIAFHLSEEDAALCRLESTRLLLASGDS